MNAFWLVVAEILSYEKLAYRTLTQCDENGNADDRSDYNSSPCTSYRRAKNLMGDKIHTRFKFVLQGTNISWAIKCFSSVFQESNHLKPILCLEVHILRIWYVLMHLRGAVLVCDVSMLIENVWNNIFTMKSTRTRSYHKTLKFCIYLPYISNTGDLVSPCYLPYISNISQRRASLF